MVVNILGHKSWNKTEVIDILRRTSTFTMCTLPHYRYDRVKQICRELQKLKLIEKSGRTDQAINFRTTSLFREWQTEFENDFTDLQPVKWAKQYFKEGRDLV